MKEGPASADPGSYLFVEKTTRSYSRYRGRHDCASRDRLLRMVQGLGRAADPIPRHPSAARPKSPSIEATTLVTPEHLVCSGFCFMAENGFFALRRRLLSAVTLRPQLEFHATQGSLTERSTSNPYENPLTSYCGPFRRASPLLDRTVRSLLTETTLGIGIRR
jgi:hypothetical protein